MPSARPSDHPGSAILISHQARAGMLLTLTCRLCRRRVNFWAADLIKVLPPFHLAHIPPFGCSRCGTSEHVDYEWTIPNAAQLAAGLTVRRPVRQVLRWIWADERA